MRVSHGLPGQWTPSCLQQDLLVCISPPPFLCFQDHLPKQTLHRTLASGPDFGQIQSEAHAGIQLLPCLASTLGEDVTRRPEAGSWGFVQGPCGKMGGPKWWPTLGISQCCEGSRACGVFHTELGAAGYGGPPLEQSGWYGLWASKPAVNTSRH